MAGALDIQDIEELNSASQVQKSINLQNPICWTRMMISLALQLIIVPVV